MGAGVGYAGTALAGELVGDVSVSRLIISASDPITGLLNSAVSGCLTYGSSGLHDKSFNFERGYITSYTSSCSLGDYATADFDVTVYGTVGSGVPVDQAYSPITPEPATAANITLTTPFGSSNAIQSYDLNISLSRQPVNKVGQLFAPTEFTTDLPIVASVNFEALVNDYQLKILSDAICFDCSGSAGCPTSFADNLKIELNNCDGGNIRTFTLNNAQLMDSSLSAGIGSDMTVSFSYNAYYNSITGMVEALF